MELISKYNKENALIIFAQSFLVFVSFIPMQEHKALVSTLEFILFCRKCHATEVLLFDCIFFFAPEFPKIYFSCDGRWMDIGHGLSLFHGMLRVRYVAHDTMAHSDDAAIHIVCVFFLSLVVVITTTAHSFSVSIFSHFVLAICYCCHWNGAHSVFLFCFFFSSCRSFCCLWPLSERKMSIRKIQTMKNDTNELHTNINSWNWCGPSHSFIHSPFWSLNCCFCSFCVFFA